MPQALSVPAWWISSKITSVLKPGSAASASNIVVCANRA